jgi:hypothetical protein
LEYNKRWEIARNNIYAISRHQTIVSRYDVLPGFTLASKLNFVGWAAACRARIISAY